MASPIRVLGSIAALAVAVSFLAACGRPPSTDDSGGCQSADCSGILLGNPIGGSGPSPTSGGASCAGSGEPCDGTPCCDPYLPDGGGSNVCLWGAICQACQSVGGDCMRDTDCCSGMSCVSSACTALNGGGSSGGTGGSTGGSSSTTSSGTSSVGGSSSGSGSGAAVPACTVYGDPCTAAEACCPGLTCDSTTGSCLAAYGQSCLSSTCADGESFCNENCADGYSCLTSSDTCGTPTQCLTFGAPGCSSGVCCAPTTCDPTDHCSIEFGNPCEPGQTCYDGSMCPAASGLCGITSSCTPYFEDCTYQPCCSGLVCDEALGCVVADGQPCWVDGGVELCVEPDACLPTTGVCACVPEGGACTPTDIGGEPCCNGFSCETGTCL